MALAARGARNMDTGDETVEEEAEKVTLRRQARRIHVESALAAAALTALSFFTPE